MNFSPPMDFRQRCSIRRLLALALLASFASATNVVASGVAETGTPPATARAEAVTAHTEGVRRIDIGAATGSLLAMQRKSEGVRPRPIDGEQASRSYQRYLKSFETSIPERFDTGLEIKK